MAPVRGLLLVYRRCMASADISCLVRFGQMWSDAIVILNWLTLYRHGSDMLHRCMCDGVHMRSPVKKNLNSTLLNNYHSHNHCLLSIQRQRYITSLYT